MPETTPAAPSTTLNAGKDTSEFKLTKVMMIASMVVAVCGGLTETLSQLTSVLPNAKWVGTAMMLISLVSAAAAQIGYALSRGMVKAGHAITMPPPNPADKAAENLNK
jgi:cation transporter-like permease